MGILEDMDKRAKKFGIIDVKLAQGIRYSHSGL